MIGDDRYTRTGILLNLMIVRALTSSGHALHSQGWFHPGPPVAKPPSYAAVGKQPAHPERMHIAAPEDRDSGSL